MKHKTQGVQCVFQNAVFPDMLLYLDTLLLGGGKELETFPETCSVISCQAELSATGFFRGKPNHQFEVGSDYCDPGAAKS